MQEKIARVILLLALATGMAALLPAPASGQFLAPEIAEREAIEEFLMTADIVRAEPIGEGVTKPLRVYLKKGDRELKAAWKNPRGMRDGYWEGWQYEIAAYRLDKLIGLHMVPPAVERELDGKKGALVYWVTVERSLLAVEEENIKIPKAALPLVDRMNYVTRAWDSLVANEDRTQQNVLYTKDWRTILIDHSRAFRSSGKFVKKLMFGKNGIKKKARDGSPFLFRRLPRPFVETVRRLTYDSVKNAVGPYLEDKEIRAVLIRRDLLLKEIEDMVGTDGEDKVLY